MIATTPVSVSHCSHFVMLQDDHSLGCLPEKQDHLGTCATSHPGSGEYSQHTFYSICNICLSDFCKCWENLMAIHHLIKLIFSLSDLPHMAFLPEIYKYYIN